MISRLDTITQKFIALPLLRHPLDFILPPACPSCQTATDQQGCLCVECWRELLFLTPPFCQGCGFSFEYDMGNFCAQCVTSPRVWQHFAHALEYNAQCKRLIVQFKYQSAFALTAFFVNLLQQAAHHLPEPDLIVPIPLHRRKLFQRQFNQSAMLAKRLAIARGTPKLYDPTVMKRTAYIRSQKGLNPAERWQNVQTAFTLEKPQKVIGKHVWLIDDVVTTSATITAASKILGKAGATISILAVARVRGNLVNFASKK